MLRLQVVSGYQLRKSDALERYKSLQGGQCREKEDASQEVMGSRIFFTWNIWSSVLLRFSSCEISTLHKLYGWICSKCKCILCTQNLNAFSKYWAIRGPDNLFKSVIAIGAFCRNTDNKLAEAGLRQTYFFNKNIIIPRFLGNCTDCSCHLLWQVKTLGEAKLVSCY